MSITPDAQTAHTPTADELERLEYSSSRRDLGPFMRHTFFWLAATYTAFHLVILVGPLFLRLIDPVGVELAGDDDSGGNKNAAINNFELPLTGQYTIHNNISGQASHFVRSMYIKTSESIRGGECSLAVVLVNDVDTGLGRWGDTASYTINQMNVFGELMHLVDYPNNVGSKETFRVPIIITGNDFTKLYEPLVRAGRMTSFEWIPTPDERVEIVWSIFPELSQAKCEQLIRELHEKLEGELPNNMKVLPIAFFAHLRASLLDQDEDAAPDPSFGRVPPSRCRPGGHRSPVDDPAQGWAGLDEAPGVGGGGLRPGN